MKWLLPIALLFTACKPDDATVSEPRGTLHRLNATEYDNSVRALFGTSQRPARRFPSDGSLHGFDNVAAVLITSSMMVDLHEMAIDDLIAELFGGPELESTSRPTDAEAPQHTQQRGGEALPGEGYWMRLNGDGVTVVYVDVPYDGHYVWDVVLVEGGGDVVVSLDGFIVEARRLDGPGSHPFNIPLEAGYRVIDLALTAYSPPGMLVDLLTLDGPLSATDDASAHYAEIVTCDPEPDTARCVREIIANFGRIAWRRPLTSDEVEIFALLYGEATSLGLSWEESLGAALKGLLFSPEFLFRVEDLAPTLGPPLLDDHAIASRLSYFLWSTTPDAELVAAADAGALSTRNEIEDQVRRMLADPKATALVDNFAGQWWGIDQLGFALPETARWDDGLRVALTAELEFLAAEFLLGGRSMREILTFEKTHGNWRIAQHYQLEYPDDGDWVTLDLAGTGRKGLLTTGGFLTVNSTEVLRGKAVMEQLMCWTFPPPPAGAAEQGLVDIETTEGSLRERVETSRTYNPDCTGCHKIMDPIGFALGTWDEAGAEQALDIYGYEIDTSGSTPDGTPVADAAELSALLAGNPDFSSCIVSKTMTYALGRKTTSAEVALVAEITADFVAGGYRFEDLAIAVATSDAFRSNALAR